MNRRKRIKKCPNMKIVYRLAVLGEKSNYKKEKNYEESCLFFAVTSVPTS